MSSIGSSNVRADFLLYGSSGFVGQEIARLAVRRGLNPILAGRNPAKVEPLAQELRLPHRVFGLEEPGAIDRALSDVALVLHAAGPYIYTSKPMVEACLRTGVHYLDITGEIPVLEALASRDGEAKAHNVMLLPAVGFDVVPTDCLALHLKRRLPTATRLALAWRSRGLTRGLPPGTANTMLEMLRRGEPRVLVRRNGRLEPVSPGASRIIDFGSGPVKATRWSWADVFTSFYSTGIPNIEDYAVLPEQSLQLMKLVAILRPLFRFPAVRNFFRGMIPSGSTPEERSKTNTFVWGEVVDEQGGKATSRLRGPEAGVEWTALAALAAVQKVLQHQAPPGFQTPAMAYGAEFVLQCDGVTREDVE